jgi:hypothetical protein
MNPKAFREEAEISGGPLLRPRRTAPSQLRARLVERKVTAEDQPKRIDIRAPQDGLVHQLAVHTVGGVITPGETMMVIVPEADNRRHGSTPAENRTSRAGSSTIAIAT